MIENIIRILTNKILILGKQFNNYSWIYKKASINNTKRIFNDFVELFNYIEFD